jgi:cell division protein FtsN
MERILKILIISIVSFLIALWVITGVNSCKDKKTDLMSETETDTSTMLEDTVELTEDIFGEDVSGDTTTPVTTSPATNTANNSELTNYVGDEETEEQEQAAPKPTAKPTEAKTSSSSKPFFIVAGNYIDKSNADVMKGKLLKLNFNNAEVVNFDMSQYFSVIAGRYKTQEEASGLASKLKNKGIDCYVKKRQN